MLDLLLKSLNQNIATYERELIPLLTKEYKQSRKARDIGKISLVEIAHDKDIIEARFEDCKACEHFVKLTSQCLKCGCFMKVKTRVAGASCPVGEWDKVIIGDRKIVPQTAR